MTLSDYQPDASPGAKTLNFLIVLFVLGWASQDFALINVGKYSILLIYVAAIPFCLRITSRSLVFMALPLISTALAAFLSLFIGGIKPTGIASQAALQLLAIFFAAGVASIDWRRYFLTLTKTLVVIGTPLIAFAGYQMVARFKHLKYAFLPVTNQQAYARGGLQRGSEKEHFTRASSVFAEPSELGYLSLWFLVLGLSAAKGRWRILSLMLGFGGLLFSQSLSGALGAGVLIIAYILVNPINVNVIRQIAIVAVVSLMAIVAVVPLMPEAFNAFSKRIEQAVTLDNRADSGRVDHLPANWQAFKDAPVWGHGLASISSAADNGVDVTTFTYFLMLIERGIVGTIFFMAPWIWLCWRSRQLPPSDLLRTPCVLFSVLNLYTFATAATAYLLPYWLALGICAACVLRTSMPSTHLAFAWSWNLGDDGHSVNPKLHRSEGE